jgi:isopropylmalate/homocitrate/citramalate synthase
VHCHDDLGLAVANALAGIRNGARQVEGTINGVGERAGNAALEEVIMGLRTRADYYGVGTGIEPREFFRTSRMVADMLGMPVPANKAVIGANAFAHSSGIHVDGFLKDRQTYEIMRPEDVGFDREPRRAHRPHRPRRSALAAGEARLRAHQGELDTDSTSASSPWPIRSRRFRRRSDRHPARRVAAGVARSSSSSTCTLQRHHRPSRRLPCACW